MTTFAAVKNILERIHIELGCEGSVLATWDGAFLSVIHSRPELVDKAGFMMRFDDQSDYDPAMTQNLITQFADASRAYFNEGIIDGLLTNQTEPALNPYLQLARELREEAAIDVESLLQ